LMEFASTNSTNASNTSIHTSTSSSLPDRELSRVPKPLDEADRKSSDGRNGYAFREVSASEVVGVVVTKVRQ
jgi:hypothetical protein